MEHLSRWFGNSASVKSISFRQGLKQLIDELGEIGWNATDGVAVGLRPLLAVPPGLADSALGICGFPLARFTEVELDAISGSDLDAAQAVLRAHNVLQYFFPPPDQLFLGAVDRGVVRPAEGRNAVELAPKLGHPVGPMEILPSDTRLVDLVDALRDKRMLVQGEYSLELGPEGAAQRATVKFSPREGLVSKIVNRISVSINLRQLVGLSIGGKRPPASDAEGKSEPSPT